MVNTNCNYLKSPNMMAANAYKDNKNGLMINFLDPTAYYSLTYAIQCSGVWSYIDRYVEYYIFIYV